MSVNATSIASKSQHVRHDRLANAKQVLRQSGTTAPTQAADSPTVSPPSVTGDAIAQLRAAQAVAAQFSARTAQANEQLASANTAPRDDKKSTPHAEATGPQAGPTQTLSLGGQTQADGQVNASQVVSADAAPRDRKKGAHHAVVTGPQTGPTQTLSLGSEIHGDWGVNGSQAVLAAEALFLRPGNPDARPVDILAGIHAQATEAYEKVCK